MYNKRKINENSMELPTAILAGAWTQDEDDLDRSMDELEKLVEACEIRTVAMITQKLDKIHQGYFFGSGKVDEIRETVEYLKADMVVVDNSLSPIQMRNLQNDLNIPVYDRTGIILEIFSNRAKTREARLQVESARLEYLLPRLVGMRSFLGRQGGAGSGGNSGGTLSNRGAGEKKLELDRRRIEHTLVAMKRELKEIEKEKETQRKKRAQSGIPRVALVGYTNAGKSTIMNQMVELYHPLQEEKQVLEKDMLFATLETTVRKISTGMNRDFLLSDTVGFISRLPHGLIQAFRSTLDEVREADLLLIVVDASDEESENQFEVTKKTLEEIGAGDIPSIRVYNKSDRIIGSEYPFHTKERIHISAKDNRSIKELADFILEKVYGSDISCKMLIPFKDGSVLGYLNEKARIENTEYVEEGTLLTLNCSQDDYNRYKQFVLS